MHIAVKGSEDQKREFLLKGIPANVTVQWLGAEDILASVKADAFFDLLFNNEFIPENEFIKGRPVFVEAVCCTAREIGHTNYIRINAWPGFINRPVIELSAMDGLAKTAAEAVLQALGWKFIWAPDEPGMIAARIISMIINEAYFALQDGISTRDEMDIAMRLGTNYPCGPFEWAGKIGLEKIHFLLKKLQQQDADRYAAAAMLEREAIK